MSDTENAFTPSTEQVRSHYVFDQTDRWDGARGEAFDRWLAAHDAKQREAGRLAALEEAEKAVNARYLPAGHYPDAEITAAAEAVRTIRALRSSSPYRADQIGEQP